MRALVLVLLVSPLAAFAQPTPEAASAFERGLAYYGEGAIDQAKEAFEEAYRLDTLFADASYNLGVFAFQEHDHASALRWFRRALSASDALTPSASDSAAVDWAATRVGILMGFLITGTQYLQEERFDEASTVFETVLVSVPEHRDALYNLALAYYQMEDWARLAPVAARLTEVDPLNENAFVLLFNAQKGIADATGESEPRLQAIAALETSQALPVYLDGLYFEQAEGIVTMRGDVRGNATSEGEPVTITFELIGPFGDVATGTSTVSAPAQGMMEPFELGIASHAVIERWRYRVGM